MERNQCDGCKRNLPLNESGDHVDPSSWMGIVGCTAEDYDEFFHEWPEEGGIRSW